MTTNYSVYLSKSNSDPESGTEGTDWIYFICGSLGHRLKAENPHQTMPGHESFRVGIGDYSFTFTLKDCVVLHAEGGTTSQYFDNLVTLICDHLDGNFDLYLWMHNPLGDSQYMQWRDNNGTLQNYCKVTIEGWNFKLNATERKIIGKISLKEVWD